MSARSWALFPNPSNDASLSPQSVEQRLRQSRLLAARLQLLVASALVWLIFVFGAVAGGIPPLGSTLLLGAWIVGSTLWLSLIALRARPATLIGQTTGRIALLCTLVTVVLASLLIRDTAGDFYLIYFFPIAVATIYYGIRGGAAAALLCAASYIFLGIATHALPLSPDSISILIGRVVLLFAMAGTIGISAEGQLSLIAELGRAYGDLTSTTTYLEETRRDLTRRIQEATTLDQVAQQITATLETGSILSTALTQVQTMLGAEASTLMTLDADSGELVFQIPRGVRASALQEYRFPVGQGIAGWVAAHKESLRVNDAAQDARFSSQADAQSGFQTRSLLAVPMILQDRVTGVIEVINKLDGKFTAEDERLLSAMARWAAIALENARLYHDRQVSLDQLQQAQARLLQTERMRALGEMASGVAHDFNNLLTIILAESQLLERQALLPKDRAAVQRITRAARDGATTVKRIQEYTRIRRDVPHESVEVNSLLQQVAALSRPRWSPIGTLSLELGEDSTINGAPGELREVLMNLVFNAVEARREEQPLHIILRSTRQADAVLIQIQDNGTGIPAEIQPRIFDPYFTTKSRGTGLGLSITYGLIARHGGKIEVTSPLPSAHGQAQSGTRFTLFLPPAAQSSKENESMSPIAPALRTLQIIFVDDDSNILSAARSLLSALGNRVVTAQTRADAEQQIHGGHYDVLMTDLTMPECSGWDLAKQSKERFPKKPVVLVTGWGLSLDPEQMKSGLVNGVLSKPFTLDELQRTLAQLTA